MYTRAVADIALWRRLATPLAQAKVVLDGGGGVKSISGLAVASPITLGVIAHGYDDGNVITVVGVRGAVEANGSWPIHVTGDNAFDLVGSSGVNPWIGGGLCVRSPIGEFDDPFGKALAFMNVTMSDPLSPGDADILGLGQYRFQELIDIAEFELFEWLSTTLSARAGMMTDQRWPDYSYRVDPQAVMFVQKQSDDKRDMVRRVYGYGAGVVRYGSINLGFQAGSIPVTDEFA